MPRRDGWDQHRRALVCVVVLHQQRSKYMSVKLSRTPSAKRRTFQLGSVSCVTNPSARALRPKNIPTDAPKSRLSRILTIRVPGIFSSASGFSLIGFHLSVPGILPYSSMPPHPSIPQHNTKQITHRNNKHYVHVVVRQIERGTDPKKDIPKSTSSSSSSASQLTTTR